MSDKVKGFSVGGCGNQFIITGFKELKIGDKVLDEEEKNIFFNMLTDDYEIKDDDGTWDITDHL